MKLEDLVLSTLSFYEPMTFSNIILDFDSEALREFPQFDKEELQQILVQLQKKKLIKKIKIEKETGWIRVLPRRPWWKRLLPYKYHLNCIIRTLFGL